MIPFILAIAGGYLIGDALSSDAPKFKDGGVTDDVVNDENIPKILYHATYKPLLNKIKENGLDTSKSKKAWEDSKPGLVYLATDIDIAASYAESSDVVPDNWIDNIVILHICTEKIDKTKLSIDKNVQGNIGDTLEYNGVIPFSAIKKVTKYE